MADVEMKVRHTMKVCIYSSLVLSFYCTRGEEGREREREGGREGGREGRREVTYRSPF